MSRSIVRHAVEKLGLTAAEVENGRAALAWLEGHPAPDIVLLDLMMPEMDGFAFLDAFREHAAWREIPVIVLTAKKLTAEERERLTGRTRQIIAKSSAIDGDVAIGGARGSATASDSGSRDRRPMTTVASNGMRTR